MWGVVFHYLRIYFYFMRSRSCTALLAKSQLSFLDQSVTMRVGQNRIYTPYMTVYLMMSLPKMLYINHIYMVLADPSYHCTCI
jgi:hypothetical protein